MFKNWQLAWVNFLKNVPFQKKKDLDINGNFKFLAFDLSQY
jgi:hypothetical protein